MRNMLIAASTLMAATAAQAHSQLKVANPAPDAVVRSAPKQLEHTFNEPVIARFVSLTVTGPGGAKLHAGPIAVDPKNRARVTAPLHGGGAPGAYRVDWTAAGSDMHRITGSYGFTVRP